MERKNSEIGLLGAIHEAVMGASLKTEKIIQRDIDKIIKVYSSITDEDVEALETSGFFDIVKSGGRYTSSVSGSDVLDAMEGSYDNMAVIKPLMAAFKSNEMTDVEALEDQLTLWAKKNAETALDYLDIAATALAALLRTARKHYRLLLSKSEAGPEDPLGRIAFATALTRKGAPYEPDTSLEKKLGKAIEAHFEGHMLLSPEMAQLLRDLMSQGLYPNMLAEPTAGIVYRGMNVEGRGVAWLKKQARGELIGKKGMIDVNMKYKPKRGAASWTTKKKVAEEFFNTGAEYHIILHARVDDNPGMFLSAEKGLYKTDFAERFVHEREAIGLGTIRVFRIEWKANEYGGAW